MAQCEKCGKDLKEGAKFCAGCGATVVEQAVDAVEETVEKKSKKAKKEVEQAVEQAVQTVEVEAAPAPQPVPAPQPAPAYTPVAQPAVAAPNALPKKLRPLTTGQFMFTMFIMAIPVVGWLYTLICALLNGINRNRRNLCRAAIYWFLIGLLLLIIAAAVGYFVLWPMYKEPIMELLQTYGIEIPFLQ